jgi:hypothetical protein
VIRSRVFDGPNEKVPCAFFRIDSDYFHSTPSSDLGNICAANISPRPKMLEKKPNHYGFKLHRIIDKNVGLDILFQP